MRARNPNAPPVSGSDTSFFDSLVAHRNDSTAARIQFEAAVKKRLQYEADALTAPWGYRQGDRARGEDPRAHYWQPNGRELFGAHPASAGYDPSYFDVGDEDSDPFGPVTPQEGTPSGVARVFSLAKDALARVLGLTHRNGDPVRDSDEELFF